MGGNVGRMGKMGKMGEMGGWLRVADRGSTVD
jgi:hypothetical protein